MTADGLARFVLSPQGEAYRRVCAFYGIDPGAPIEDDVLAHDLRTALMIAMPKPEPEAVDDRAGIVTDLDKVIARMERSG